MASQFQAANEAALLSVGSRIEWSPSVRRWNSDDHSLAPTLDSDGAPVGNAVVGVLAVSLDGAASAGEIMVYLYTGAPGVEGEGWVKARNGAFTIDEDGLTERITLAGYKRVYVRWLGVTGSGPCYASIGFGVSS